MRRQIGVFSTKIKWTKGLCIIKYKPLYFPSFKYLYNKQPKIWKIFNITTLVEWKLRNSLVQFLKQMCSQNELDFNYAYTNKIKNKMLIVLFCLKITF